MAGGTHRAEPLGRAHPVRVVQRHAGPFAGRGHGRTRRKLLLARAAATYCWTWSSPPGSPSSCGTSWSGPTSWWRCSTSCPACRWTADGWLNPQSGRSRVPKTAAPSRPAGPGRMIVVLIVGYFVDLPAYPQRTAGFQVLLVGGSRRRLHVVGRIAGHHARQAAPAPAAGVACAALMEPATALAVESTLADVSARIASRGGRVILVDAGRNPARRSSTNRPCARSTPSCGRRQPGTLRGAGPEPRCGGQRQRRRTRP